MKCPLCTETDLVMTERQGVEIDYCPKCRGVWLDRGELDKIIERSVPMAETAPNLPPNAPPGFGHQQEYRDFHGHHDEHGHGDKHGYHGQYRKKSWLSELFD